MNPMSSDYVMNDGRSEANNIFSNTSNLKKGTKP